MNPVISRRGVQKMENTAMKYPHAHKLGVYGCENVNSTNELLRDKKIC